MQSSEAFVVTTKVNRMRGFTLIEMLLSVAIITMLAGLGLPIYQSYQTRNDLFITAQKTADALRRAETYSRGGSYGSPWGVSITSSGVTHFKGTTYATRDSNYDESFTIPSWVTVSASTEVDFAQLTGAPTNTSAASVTFTSSSGSVRTVNVNSEGTVWS